MPNLLNFASRQCGIPGFALPIAFTFGCCITLLSGCSAERKNDARRPAETEPAAAEAVLPDEVIPVPLSTETQESGFDSDQGFSNAEVADPFAPTRSARIQTFNQQVPSIESSGLDPAIEPQSAAEPPSIAESSAPPTGPFATLPAGAAHDAENSYATVAVYYATDRARDALALSAYNLTGNRDAVVLLGVSAIVFLSFALLNAWRRRFQVGIGFSLFATAAAAGAVMVLISGAAKIEKHGVTYNSDRGSLVKGIAKVTVPDSHQRGVVERPSLLRFEVREDQREHIVLTSAIELSDADFTSRLSETVALSPNQDLLVFVHGYNVDFESAIQRTAQIAVDLPFEGVPICYSWPSQGTLLGYTVDETNATWTQTHLKQFLLELAQESGARSINVVAHSMGNRPTTGALVEIGMRSALDPEQAKPFDRLVLAAPDIDADQFRRDLAPALNQIADHITLYASSDDRALMVSKQVHGYPRAGESGEAIVVVDGIETIDVSGIDLSLLGHSYYGDNPSMLQDLYQVVRSRLPAHQRRQLEPRRNGELTYWQLISQTARRVPESLPLTPVR